MLKNSLVAMGLNGGIIDDVKVELVEDLSREGVKNTFARFERHFSEPMASMDFQKYVGLT